MFAIGITLLTALLLSVVAAYFSIVGLMAIFASAAIPIAVMGGTLELAKVVSASWVYRNWRTAPALIRYYLTIAIVVLSIITSLGIFGYLSKAHLDQAIPSGDIAAKLALVDEKIKVEKDNIDVSRKESNRWMNRWTKLWQGQMMKKVPTRQKSTQSPTEGT